MMKCIHCRKDAKKKDRDQNHGRCPSCHHEFVADPTTDGLTDMAIKTAEDIVSANGTFCFLSSQLKYQLHRKLTKKLTVFNIVLFVTAPLFIAFLVFAMTVGKFFIVLTILSGIVFLAILSAKSMLKKALSKLDHVVKKWIKINPHSKLLNTNKYQPAQTTQNNQLDGISFERVLICERDETVDFLLSNLFHFHYSCPVLSGNGYPQTVCDDMVQRLKQNPQLNVFLLHDYSPAGLAFVRRMKTDTKWFGGGRYRIIDLGLNVNQKKLFKAMTVKKTDRNRKVNEMAEIDLFQPAALMTLCGAAINEGVPFDLLPAMVDQRHQGYG